ncbi:MAG: hypothetical protein HZC38_05035 [Chloroflexi bacterium]|nr:hypothetical protein [Chloroflexota bacterium]
MADSIQVIGGGVEAVRTVLPTSFNWLLFFVALILMCAPSVDMGRQMIQNPNFNFADRTDLAGFAKRPVAKRSG